MVVWLLLKSTDPLIKFILILVTALKRNKTLQFVLSLQLLKRIFTLKN